MKRQILWQEINVIRHNECASDVPEVRASTFWVYLDDVFVFSTTCEKHQIHLALILRRLRKEEFFLTFNFFLILNFF
ncbi:hypothetical protein T11_14903 [Trichinella zimbabwensis]|uniref:Reverse transcriptase domain-containing protein n=1 Tax=Trichinella zimbabwensis TaxID=268475 RepID=A0A0V1I8V9_9BILA|nr:hypothetical protein T11_14903 [Trichinella zimbabwensis]